MKRSELFFSLLQVLIDFLLIILAALVAYQLRHTPEVQFIINKPEIYTLSRREFFNIILIVAPVIILFYATEGLYRIRVTRKFWQETFSVFKATTIVLVLIMLGFFLQREWFSSRFIIFTGWTLTIGAVVAGRLIMQLVQRWLLINRGIGHHRVLLIGGHQKMKHLHKAIAEKPQLGYRVIDHLQYVNLKEIKHIKNQHGIDEVFVSEASIPDDLIAKLHDFAQIHGITYKSIPSSLQTTRFEMKIFEGEPLIEMHHTPLDGWGKIAKRTFDIAGSCALILFLSPLMTIIAAVLKLSDRGPVIYKSERIADSGQKFYAYKFRYIKWKYCIHPDNPDMEEAKAYEQELIKKYNTRKGALYKIKDDPRKSAFGSFIEKYSLDELPQLFNVLFGDMSLVGPRPHQEREVMKYHEYHRRLLTIKPGLTGMAQVSGRSDLDFEDEYRFDVYYIENWSLWLDVIIILKTPAALFSRRKNN